MVLFAETQMPTDWQTVRAQFPVLKEWVYLNTATFGPVPTCAVEAAANHFSRRDREACLDFLDWYTDADTVRAQAAELIGADPDDVAFIPNAATALSWLVNGIRWTPGDHVVTLPHEFPNNEYFARVLEQRGVKHTQAAVPEGLFSVDKFLAEITDRTKLVILSAVNYSTGLRPPLEEIGPALRERNVLFFLDGTQGVGALEMDAHAVQPDVLAVHGYKWLLCPMGIGFAYVGPRVREWLPPSLYSWRSHKDWRNVDQLHEGLPELPQAAMKYEGGGQNFAGIYAMGAVLELLHSLGAEAIEERVLELAAKTRNILRARGGILRYDQHPYYDSPIVSAQFPGVDMSALAVELRRRRIAVAARKGNLRVSPHFFNDEQDLRKLDEALAILVKS